MSEFREENGWVMDNQGNRASVKKWGSCEAAEKSLESLVGCSDCSDCSDCSGCYDCYDCSRCSDCSGCSDCSRCSGCSGKNESFAVQIIENIHIKVRDAILSPGNQLEMSEWHSCQTTHCRGGWVVHLAGKAGHELEEKTSPLFAAMQIYKASGFEISPVRFFASNEKAMEDIERLATQERNV